MKALITGGTGFLGSHVTRALCDAGYDVTVLARRFEDTCLDADLFDRIERITADVRDEAAVIDAAAGCDWIFHCAAMVGADTYARYPVETMETETLALQSVCRAALHHDVTRLIFPSTSAVYGNIDSADSLREDGPLVPASPYAIAKRYNELYLAAQHQENGLRSVSLRIFNVYGPKQDERLVIPRFMKQAMTGEPLVIYGDGSQTRDFVYIDDVVNAAIRCAESDAEYEIVNVATGQESSVRTLAEGIIAASGSSSEISCVTPPSPRNELEVSRCVGSTERLSSLFGCTPTTGLAEGLQRTFDSLNT